MNKKKFEELEKQYKEKRERLSKINPGDLVWLPSLEDPLQMRYCPAIVKSVDIDEDKIEVVEVYNTLPLTENACIYSDVYTEEEMREKGFTDNDFDEEKERVKQVIDKYKEDK